MFVDIHSHILPNIDDGAKDIIETKKMLKIAEQQGIRHLIATPHYIMDNNNYDIAKLSEVFNDIKKYIQENNIDIHLYVGNEILLESGIELHFQDKRVMTLGDSRYVLVEVPNNWNWQMLSNWIYNIKQLEYIPVIAHIERFIEDKEDMLKLKELIEQGCYTQVNSNSIISSNKKIKKLTKKLLVNNYVHFIGTDAHSSNRRPPNIEEAYNKSCKLIGKNKSNKLFYSNGINLLKNIDIAIDEPIIHSRKFFEIRRQL